MATPEALPVDIAHACGLIVHDLGGAGPIYGAAATPAGWRYFSDQFHHRIIIQTPCGTRRFVGRPGDGAGEFRFPRGLAVCPAESPKGTRLFVCDAWNHRVQVFDGEGRPVGAFGRAGRNPGEFDVPSDVAVVRPERVGAAGEQAAPLIAVADRWNNRVQIFELDGHLVTSIGDRDEKPLTVALTGVSARAGWPLFRVAPDPACWFPTRLHWHAPMLEIVGANDRRLSIDLAAALLPDFETWLEQADADAVDEAAELFRNREGTPEAAPGERLAAIETRLGTLLASAGSPVGAARIWARSWPAGMTADQVEENVAERARAVTEAWLCSGGSTGISRLATAVSRELSRTRAIRARSMAQREVATLRAGSLGGIIDHGGTPGGTDTGPNRDLQVEFDRTARLAHQLRLVRGRAQQQGHVVWEAPAGDTRLGVLGTSEDQIVAVSKSGSAMWVFDRMMAPLSRVGLFEGCDITGVVAHPMGGWLLVDRAQNRLVHIDREGHPIWQVGNSDGSGSFDGLAGVVIDGDLVVVADSGNDRLVTLDLAGNVLGTLPCVATPVALAAADGRLWVASWADGGIYLLESATGLVISRHVHELVGAVSALALASDGSVVAAERWLGRLHTFDDQGRWAGAVEAADGRPMGGLGGVAVIDGRRAIVSDREHGWLVRVELPSGGRRWPLNL